MAGLLERSLGSRGREMPYAMSSFLVLSSVVIILAEALEQFM